MNAKHFSLISYANARYQNCMLMCNEHNCVCDIKKFDAILTGLSVCFGLICEQIEIISLYSIY
jgi:hypothetical protein